MFSLGSASQSKALPQWPHGKASHGQVKVGHGIQGVPCISRWIHEPTGKQSNIWKNKWKNLVVVSSYTGEFDLMD